MNQVLQKNSIDHNCNDCSYFVVSARGLVSYLPQRDITCVQMACYNVELFFLDAQVIKEPLMKVFVSLTLCYTVDYINFCCRLRYSHFARNSRQAFPTSPRKKHVLFLRKYSNLAIKWLQGSDLGKKIKQKFRKRLKCKNKKLIRGSNAKLEHVLTSILLLRFWINGSWSLSVALFLDLEKT